MQTLSQELITKHQWLVHMVQSFHTLQNYCYRKGSFFTKEMILFISSLFMLLSSPVHLFFLVCTKLLIWPLLVSLLSLGWIGLVFKPNNCLYNLNGEIPMTAWCGFTATAKGTRRINSRTFTCYTWLAHDCPWNCQLSNYLWCLEKKGRGGGYG